MKIILTSLFILFSCSGFSQDTIRISPELYLLKLSQQLYVHVSYHTLEEYGRFTCNGMILQTEEDKVWLYDTPMDDSITQQLVAWIERSLTSTIEVLVPNHFHDDCIGGLNVIMAHNPDCIVFANALTYELLDEEYKAAEIMYMLFEKIGPMDKREHYYLGAAHTQDNIVVWFPQEKVLFGGCMVKSTNANSLGNIADANLKEWPKTIKKVKRKFRKANVVIPGHGDMGDRSILEHTLDLLKEN